MAAAALLALPLLLFAWLSHVKLGEMSFSYYVPYEELRQGLATGELRAIYYAPLVAVNVRQAPDRELRRRGIALRVTRA